MASSNVYAVISHPTATATGKEDPVLNDPFKFASNLIGICSNYESAKEMAIQSAFKLRDEYNDEYLRVTLTHRDSYCLSRLQLFKEKDTILIYLGYNTKKPIYQIKIITMPMTTSFKFEFNQS